MKKIITSDIKRLVNMYPPRRLSTQYYSKEKLCNVLNYILFEIFEAVSFESNNPDIIKILKYIDMEIKNSAKNDASVQAGQKDDKAVVDEISNAVNPKDIEELANSDGAALKLAQIMSSGIYVKDGQRIRLTRKQRVALSNALAQAVEKKMDSNSKNKNNNNKGKSGQVVVKEMGEE
jgi:hypothetical protein